MSSPIAVVMTGRGGQGGKLAMELLAWSASADGLVPVLYSVYGALIRGADIASFLAAGVTSPGVAQRDSHHVMCALHNNWFDRYYALLRPGGVLVADASYITASMRSRGDVTNLVAPWSQLAQQAGDRRAAHMVAAGAIAALSQIATPAALEQGMNAVVPPHRADRIAANLAAVRAGYEWAALPACTTPSQCRCWHRTGRCQRAASGWPCRYSASVIVREAIGRQTRVVIPRTDPEVHDSER